MALKIKCFDPKSPPAVEQGSKVCDSIAQAFPDLSNKAHIPGLQVFFANVSSLSLKARTYLHNTKFKVLMLAELHNTDSQKVRTFFGSSGLMPLSHLQYKPSMVMAMSAGSVLQYIGTIFLKRSLVEFGTILLRI